MRGQELALRSQAEFFEAARMGIEAGHAPELIPPSLGFLTASGEASELAEQQQEANMERLGSLLENRWDAQTAAARNMMKVCGY
jgi:hypothetical protein